VPAGKYTLTPTHPAHSFDPRRKQIVVAAAVVRVNFEAQSIAVLTARVLNANKDPMPGVTVELQSLANGAVVQRVNTDADGWAQFQWPAVGRFLMVPKPPDRSVKFKPESTTWTIGAQVNPCGGSHEQFVATRNSVEIAALEAVQVIQDWQNNVPLVARKPTLVRAFLKPTGTNRTPVAVRGARLVVESGGRVITRVNAAEDGWARPDFDSDANRKSAKGSLNFRLPAEAIRGTNSYTLDWPNGQLDTYRDAAGQQTAVRGNATELRFQDMPELPILWVQTTWKFGMTTRATTAAEMQQQHDRLQASLPTHRVPVPAVANTLTLEWRPPSDPSVVLDEADQRTLEKHLLNAVETLRRRDQRDNPLRDRRLIYHAVVGGVEISGMAWDIGAGFSSCAIAADPLNTDRRRNEQAHELGHLLGRHHCVHALFGLRHISGVPYKRGFCKEVASILAPDFPMDVHGANPLAPVLGPMRLGPYRMGYGWDSGAAALGGNVLISPFGVADLMSYCAWDDHQWRWPGLHTYTNMLAGLRARAAARPGRFDGFAKNLDATRYLEVSGAISSTNGALLTWNPLRPMDSAGTYFEPAESPYAAVLLDGMGLVLGTVRFEPTHGIIEGGSEVEPDTFSFDLPVPEIAGLAAVEIRAGDQVLGRRVLSTQPPVVRLEPAPVLANLGQAPLILRWEATHPEDQTLLASIDVSVDDGVSWRPLALEFAGTEFELRAEDLPPTTTGRIRVRVTDGYRETVAVSAGLIHNPPVAPHVVVLDPAEGTLVRTNQQLTLRAATLDRTVGELADDRITWTSDRDGALGTGTELILPEGRLSEGTHLLTVTGLAPSGLTASASVRLLVVPRLLPSLSVRLAGSMIEVSWSAEALTASLRASYSPGGGWFVPDAEPELDGDRVVVRLPADEEPLFFRLGDGDGVSAE
jgi:hypothetical protein